MVTRGGGGGRCVDTPFPDLITPVLAAMAPHRETRPDMILFFLLRPPVGQLQQQWRAEAQGHRPPPTPIRNNLAVADGKQESLAPAPLRAIVPSWSMAVDVR